MKIKPKWKKLIHHFTRFCDVRWFPNYIPTQKACDAFIKFQSVGRKELSKEEILLIQPLLDAQEGKELTIKMLISEMADFWSKGWGWYIPLTATIEYEFRDRHIHKDKVYIYALIKIARNIQDSNFVEYLQSFTGLSKEEKDKYFVNYLATTEKYGH